MDLKDNVALVTGGAVRMGRAICGRLAAAGANVVIHYRRSEAEAEELKKRLETDHGVRAVIAQADLSSQAACASLVAAACDAMGRMDILVNNAAVFDKDRLADVSEEKVMKEFWPNLLAPMFLIQAFAQRSDGGKIVNMLDRRITSDDTSCVPYLLSKKGLASLTRLAALELAPRFTVNGVAPGAILPPPGESGEYLKEKGGYVPLERQCTPEEIAEAVYFLLSHDALTGQVIYVDGGQHLLGSGVME